MEKNRWLLVGHWTLQKKETKKNNNYKQHSSAKLQASENPQMS